MPPHTSAPASRTRPQHHMTGSPRTPRLSGISRRPPGTCDVLAHLGPSGETSAGFLTDPAALHLQDPLHCTVMWRMAAFFIVHRVPRSHGDRRLKKRSHTTPRVGANRPTDGRIGTAHGPDVGRDRGRLVRAHPTVGLRANANRPSNAPNDPRSRTRPCVRRARPVRRNQPPRRRRPPPRPPGATAGRVQIAVHIRR